MSPERRSLQEAFAPAPTGARGTKLEGLLPPKRGRAEAKPDETKSRIEKSDETPAAPARPEGNAKPATAPAASKDVPGPVRNIGVYVEPELLTHLRAWNRQQRTSYSDMLVEAFDHIEDSSIAKEFEVPRTSSGSGMPKRVRRPRGTAGIQVQLRLDDRQVEWLEDKAQRLQAPSRSALVSTVFKLYMNQSQQ